MDVQVGRKAAVDIKELPDVGLPAQELGRARVA